MPPYHAAAADMSISGSKKFIASTSITNLSSALSRSIHKNGKAFIGSLHKEKVRTPWSKCTKAQKNVWKINKRRNGWYYESKILLCIGSLFGRGFFIQKRVGWEETGKKLDRGSRHDGPSNKSLDYLIDSFNSVHARMGFTAHIFSLLAIWLSSALWGDRSLSWSHSLMFSFTFRVFYVWSNKSCSNCFFLFSLPHLPFSKQKWK